MMNTDQKAQLAASLAEGALFLYRMASLLRHKRFASFYGDNSSRFSWATPVLFARLRRDLQTQLTQAVVAVGEEPFAQLARQCEQQAAAFEEAAQTRVRKSDRAFRLAAGQEGTMAIVQFLSRTTMPPCVRYDARPGAAAFNGVKVDFYLRNALVSLCTFAQAVDTLRFPLPNPVFERVLADLDAQWLLEGYPHDLLAHDADSIRHGDRPKALALRLAYCASHIVRANEPFAGSATEWRQVSF